MLQACQLLTNTGCNATPNGSYCYAWMELQMKNFNNKMLFESSYLKNKKKLMSNLLADWAWRVLLVLAVPSYHQESISQIL